MGSDTMEPGIGSVLKRAVDQFGSKEATVDLKTGERRTWLEVSARVAGVAAGLRDVAEVGDRVGVLALNSARHLEVWFAIPAAGMVMNDLNYRLAAEELAFIASDSNMKVLFVDANFAEVGQQLLERCDELTTLVHMEPGSEAPDAMLPYDAWADSGAAADIGWAGTGGDLAAIFYTGGTTGLPKGAMLSHRNLTSNALHVVAAGQMTENDRYLHCGPQFHLADGAFAYATTWVGGTHAFVPAFDPAGTIAAFESEKITSTLMVPTMIAMTLALESLPSTDLSSLRMVAYGASPMPGEVQKQAMELYGPVFIQAYGMTEASPVVTWMGQDAHVRGIAGEEPWASRLRSAGSPVVGVDVEVRNADGALCAPGEAGEIYVQGPNIMSGYWNRPEETAFALVDGWYRSGDVAYRDEGGYVYVVDRAKDMIISGGENIYTSEVENAVYSHPAVLEAAVFGIPSEEWGETVHVEVVLKPDVALTEDEMVAHCRELIAGYKLPRSVAFRTADNPLPKSGAGKILKRDLREPWWEGHDRRVG